MKLDFTNHPAAEDMISIVKQDKGLSTSDAISFAINEETYASIIRTGWASIALGLWGHGDPEREWLSLEDSCVEMELEQSKRELLNEVKRKEKVNTETAVSYFLLFVMESMGYHI